MKVSSAFKYFTINNWDLPGDDAYLLVKHNMNFHSFQSFLNKRVTVKSYAVKSFKHFHLKSYDSQCTK